MSRELVDMDAAVSQYIFAQLAAGATNAATARKVGCDRRTVRRYRRLVNLLDLPPAVAARMPADEIITVLNAREPRNEAPDFAALEWEFPGTTARFRYERYCERRLEAGKPALSVAQFNRLRVEHEFSRESNFWIAPTAAMCRSHAESRCVL